MKKAFIAIFIIGLSAITLLPFFYEDEASVAQNKFAIAEEEDQSITPLPVLPALRRHSAKQRQPLFASFTKNLGKIFTENILKGTQNAQTPQDVQAQGEPSQDDVLSSAENYDNGAYEQGGNNAGYYDHAATRRARSSEKEANEDGLMQEVPFDNVPVKGIHNISTDERAQQIFDSSKVHDEVMERVNDSAKGEDMKLPPLEGPVGKEANPSVILYAGKAGAYGQDGRKGAKEGEGSLPPSDGSAYEGIGKKEGKISSMGASYPDDGASKDTRVELGPDFQAALSKTENIVRNADKYYGEVKEEMHDQMRENSQPISSGGNQKPSAAKPKEFNPGEWQNVPNFTGCSFEEKKPSPPEKADSLVNDVEENCDRQPDPQKIKEKITEKKPILINAGVIESGRFVIVAGKNKDGKDSIPVKAIEASGGVVREVKGLDLSADNSSGKNIQQPKLTNAQKKELTEKGLAVLNSAEYRKFKDKDEVIVLTVNKDESGTLYAKPEDFNKYSTLAEVVKQINQSASNNPGDKK